MDYLLYGNKTDKQSTTKITKLNPSGLRIELILSRPHNTHLMRKLLL